MSENHTPPSFEGNVEDLATSIAQERAEARRTSRTLMGVTAAMLIICGGSVFSMLAAGWWRSWTASCSTSSPTPRTA